MPSERIQRQIERLLDAAEEAISRFDWEAVHHHAEAVLALDPGNSDGLALVAAAKRGLVSGAPSPPGQAAPPLPSSMPASTVATPLTAAFANGRYVVKRFLGEGAKKRVYLAYDSRLDRDVAFALIKTEGLDEWSKARVTREAQAMGRLGSHPHIVAVYDLGQDPSSASGGSGQAQGQP